MKILKIFGAVLAVHAVAFMLIFANPGCSSTSKPTASAAPTETAAPAVVTMPAIATAPAEISPLSGAPLPATSGSFDPNAPALSAAVRYSPTRPGTPAATAVQAQPVADVMPATTYAVGNGDSLWTVAKKNHLTVSELAAANNLPASTKLKLGQKLIIPGKSTDATSTMSASAPSSGSVYKIKTGDTLASVAKRAGTTMAVLKQMNNLKSDTVRLGQELKLPAGTTMADAAPAAMATPDLPAAKPANANGSVTHVVKAGETLGTIARKYQVKQGDIAVANNITNPALIKVGMTLVIPGWQAPKSAKGTTTTSATAPVAKPAGEQNPLLTVPSADQGADAGPKPVPATDVPVIKVDDTPAAGTPKNP
jgi:LysM repeat protein